MHIPRASDCGASTGEGGVNLATPDLLKARGFMRSTSRPFDFDEVRFGAYGQYAAHEAYGVTPDMMTLAKPLAGGLPIGAILETQTVADD